MNSASPKLQDPAKTPEPTMDEILASIRRIITEDQSAAAPAPRLPVAEERIPRQDAGRPDGARADSLRREAAAHERMHRGEPFLPETPRRPVAAEESGAAVRPPAPGPAPHATPLNAPAGREGFSRAAIERSVAEEAMPSLVASLSAALPPRQPEPASAQREARDELLSPQTGARVASSFEALTSNVSGQGARTLEDLVRDMLRPMLKAWLDDNLPAIVERLVRQEIERVARGGRR
ncbi:Cell pole-organizing protein PopZ [Chelatococcus sambhunathii]|uniref:DUF2497 domain-containing protein n=2 Tax=Chelatococcus TaxID=28209 RepID=A0AAC9JRZ3_9HYPH|nr:MULTISPECIES: DUF2497 domain-containing protein [Chelatococcus]APF37406.1 hypothetical protein BOQ54_08750 [Chelatococcus daeguensis]CUA86449.1 Cell pole-organizing protein PopZ [Chelatococcus sambhunathii]